MRSPTWYSSVGTRSRFGSSASYLPRSTNHVRTVKTPHGAADDVADAVLEFGENQRLLRAADLLHQRLLGVLRGDAAKTGGRDFHFEFLADLGVGLDAAGVEHGNLVVLGNDLLGDDQFGEGPDVAVFLVDVDAQFARRADRLFGGGQARPPGQQPTRTSRLMPFSRSQNSRTAKKSAFITLRTAIPIRGTKKSAD